MIPRTGEGGGFALIPVTLILGLLAAATFLMTFEGSFGVRTLAGEAAGDRALYLAQAGLRHAQESAGASACANYALPETAFGAGAYEATFSPSSGSPVRVTAVGSLPDGSRRTLVREGVAIQDASNPGALVLSPGSEGKDSFIESKSGHEDHNKGGDLTIRLDAASGTEDRGLIEFDLSTLPPSVRVVRAELSLEVKSLGSANTFLVHRLTRAWIESEVTWLSANASELWTTPVEISPTSSKAGSCSTRPGSRPST